MASTNIQLEKFNKLLNICGSHSQAARELNIHPVHYRYVRRTGKVSRLVELMIEKIIEESKHHTIKNS